MGMAAIFIIWTGPFEQIFILTTYKSSTWNVVSMGLEDVWKLQSEWPWTKVKTMTLISSTHMYSCTHFSTTSANFQFIDFNSFYKIYCLSIFLYKSIKEQSWRSRFTEGHHLKKLCRVRLTDAVCQVQMSSACWFRRTFLNCFYHISAWRASYGHIWAWRPDHLNKLSFPHPSETSYKIWLWSAQWFLRRGRRATEPADSWRVS